MRLLRPSTPTGRRAPRRDGIAATSVRSRSPRNTAALAELRVDYGAPIGFMLATPIPYGEVYKELGDATWHLEDKYDGIRAQAHVRNGTVRLFSRRLNDVTESYPEVATRARCALERRHPRR